MTIWRMDGIMYVFLLMDTDKEDEKKTLGEWWKTKNSGKSISLVSKGTMSISIRFYLNLKSFWYHDKSWIQICGGRDPSKALIKYVKLKTIQYK